MRAAKSGAAPATVSGEAEVVCHWREERWETHWMLLLPAVFTAFLSVLVGVLAGRTVPHPSGWGC